MANYHSENEILKRRYTFFLEAAHGKQCSTADASLKAIERFEISTGFKPFSKFHLEQVRAFRSHLADATGRHGRPLSAATITSTLKRLRDFFLWLSREPGYRSKINANDVQHFMPTDQDRRIASARREKHVASLEDINLVLSLMPTVTDVDFRNRAMIAFAILSGARDGAMASFRLKHVSLSAQTVFHDGREVNSKRRKTFTSNFFPVGSEPLKIVADYIGMLIKLGFSPDDPLFPASRPSKRADGNLSRDCLSRECLRSAEQIREVFRAAFARAGLPYANPHSFRNTLVRLGQRRCRSPEEWKAWSQNLGHESETTTFVGYGYVPAARPAEIIRSLEDAPRPGVSSDEIAALEKLVNRIKAAGAA